MEPATHLGIDTSLCGAVLALAEGEATVLLSTTPAMGVDAEGLVHGGFVFGAADHAAMLAVNDPFVVLGSASTRFLAPVRVGEQVTLRAVRTEVDRRKHTVEVTGTVEDTTVFTGSFTTFVLDRHVLNGRSA
ncbi:MAG: thioesterase family protein [Alphaproteobacteria bacterium]|nr:thioesterase family protein [Alphaproteobacteria bacterium]